MSKYDEWGDVPLNIKEMIKGASQPFRIDDEVALESMMKQAFLRIWFKYDQGQPFGVNWHHRYVAMIQYKILKGEIKNIVVNQPPGSSKSETWCIFFPAFASVNFDKVRILTLSYSKSLVDEHANRVMGIFNSEEFSSLWNRPFGKQSVDNFTLKNEKGKVCFQSFARSMQGQITGCRGGFLSDGYTGHVMMDDPQKPEDMFSEVKRKKSNNILNNTVRSRRMKSDTPVIIIQQRLHVNDASGFALAGGMGLDFDHINIPALITQEYIDSLPEPVRSWCEEDVKSAPSRIIGGVEYWSYWPQKDNIDDLIRAWEKDEYTFLSQYMQNPKALAGGLIDTEWFPTYKQLPPLQWRAVYVDTNSGKVKDFNDFTVFTHAGLGKDGKLYIIDVERGKWDPEELLQKAEEVWGRWKPWTHKYPANLRYMAIEDKQAGQGLIQTLKKRNNIPVEDIQRGAEQNKLIRCLNSIPYFKPGNVLIPETTISEGGKKDYNVYNNVGDIVGSTTWVIAALKEAADFSADDSHEHDDILDTWFDAVQDMLVNSTPSFDDWL